MRLLFCSVLVVATSCLACGNERVTGADARAETPTLATPMADPTLSRSGMPLAGPALGPTPTPLPRACVAPDAPSLTINTGTRALTWNPVRHATSYKFYLRQVPSCDMLTTPPTFLPRDVVSAHVSSPIDVSQYNQCHTCYYATITAVSGSCESALDGSVGFMLIPCR